MHSNQIARVTSNFARMGITFIAGLIIVRMVLDMGTEVYALYALIVAGFGIGILTREMLRVSLIGHFNAEVETYGTDTSQYSGFLAKTFKLSAICAVLGILIMLGIAWLLPLFGVGSENLLTARVFVVSRAIYVFATILIYPLFIHVISQRRQVLLNTFLAVERILELFSLFICFTLFPELEPFSLFASFGVLFLVFVMIFYVAIYIWLLPFEVLLEGCFKTSALPVLKLYRKDIWNGFRDVLGPLLYLRFDIIFLSVIFGPASAVLLGITIQLTGYIRQCSLGMVGGLEAVFGRLHFSGPVDQDQTASHSLFKTATALQAVSMLFFCSFIVVELDTLLNIWLGDKLDASIYGLNELRLIIMLTIPGVMANSLSEGWTSMLTGAGHLGRFVGVIIGLAILNPLVMFFAVMFVGLLPLTALVTAAVVFSILNIICHVVVLPAIVSKCIGISIYELFTPFLNPLAGLAITLIIYRLASGMLSQESLLASGVIFSSGIMITAFATLISQR